MEACFMVYVVFINNYCITVFGIRGYKRFFRRTSLETSVFLKDDCLKINCTVGVVVSGIDSSRLHSIHVPESDIGDHFGTLLENEEGSDITFNVSGEKFRAHKLVLAARSPVFENDFVNMMEEDNDEILVTEMEPRVFKVNSLENYYFCHFQYVIHVTCRRSNVILVFC